MFCLCDDEKRSGGGGGGSNGSEKSIKFHPHAHYQKCLWTKSEWISRIYMLLSNRQKKRENGADGDMEKWNID